MAARGEELNTRITATDDASAVVDKVADKVADLEDKPHNVEVGADTDKAEAATRQLDQRLEGLTNDEKRVVLDLIAKDAQRDLDRINRDLARAERFTDKELQLRLEARGNAEQKLRAVRDELGEIEEAARDADDEISDIGDQAGSKLAARFEGLGSLLGGKLLAGLGWTSLGAVLAEGIQRGFDAAGGIRQIRNEFALTADEAERYGKIAGELYADNWGDALTEVQRNVALVAQRIGATTDTELASITRSVMAVSQTWGQQFDAVVRSTTQLLQNGLAPNAQTALDLIVRAFQEGGDEAGDLLDTIDEYSQHWAAMGLSGQEALSIVIDGLRNGQRDADKLADAIKEMRIRGVEDTEAVREAYKELGLDADRTRLAFLAGGEDARRAYLDVLRALKSVDDPIAQQRLAVQLIGTQFEDLGPKAIDSLLAIKDGLTDVNGAAEDVSNTIEATPWDQFKRDAESALTDLGNDFGTLYSDIKSGWQDVRREIRDLPGGSGLLDALFDTNLLEFPRKSKEAWDDFGRTLGILEDDTDHVHQKWQLLSDLFSGPLQRALEQAESQLRFVDGEARPTADTLERLSTAADGNATSFDKARTSADLYAESLSQRGLAVAAEQAETALSNLQKQISDERLYLDLADQLQRVAETQAAIGPAAEESAEKGAQAARDHRREVLRLQEIVIQLLGTMEDIPSQKRTEILLQIASGDLDKIDAAIDELTQARYIPIGFVLPKTRDAFDAIQIAIGNGAVPALQFQGQSAPPAGAYVDQRQTIVYPPIGSTPTTHAEQGRDYLRWNGPR